jgi:hypothetical protein
LELRFGHPSPPHRIRRRPSLTALLDPVRSVLIPGAPVDANVVIGHAVTLAVGVRPRSRLAHDRTTHRGTARHQTTRNDTWNADPCLARATLGSGGREAVGVRVSPLAPLSFATPRGCRLAFGSSHGRAERSLSLASSMSRRPCDHLRSSWRSQGWSSSDRCGATEMAAFPGTMRRAREREGLRECRAAWLSGVSVREYREIEAGERDPTSTRGGVRATCSTGR